MTALPSHDLDTAGSLLIEERVEYKFEDGDAERYAHYVDKDALMEATVNGTPCVALCGKKWVPTKDAVRFPVCPACRAIYDGIPTGDQPSDGAGE